MAAKSRDAFRTISEVSDWLDTPAHVLRFWESKFSQIKPVKRAGGRRYYRPQDMALLGGIKTLLHDQGMTIKGAQKLLREKGVKYVANLGSAPADAAEPQPIAAATPVVDTPTASTPEIAAVPVQTDDRPAPPARFFVAYAKADPDKLHALKPRIAPLVARLDALHSQMLGS